MATGEIHFAQAVIECKVCDKGNSVEWKCVTCGEIMCTSCKTFHLRSKALRHHKVLHINDINERLDANPSDEDVPVQCNTHSNELVQLFCEPCDELVCHDCISGKHNGHTFVKIFTVTDQKKSELQGYITKAKQKITVKQTLQKAATSNIKKYAGAKRECSTSLKEKCNHIKSTIDSVKNDIEAELQQEEKRNQTTCDKMIKDTEKEITDIQEFVKTCESKMAAPSTEMIQFLSKAKTSFSNFKDKTPPKMLPIPKFTPGDADEKTVQKIIGCLGYDKEGQNSEVTYSRPMYKAKVMSSFQTENEVGRICPADDDKVWIGRYKNSNITLVNSEGKVIRNLDTGLEVYDFKVHPNGHSLLTEYHGYSVKKLSKNDDTFTDLCDMSPFYTYGMDVIHTGDIIVGLCDIQGSNEGKIVKISPNGRILQSLQYANDGKTPLFECIAAIKQMQNGNLCAIQIDENNRRNVICVDWSGNIKFKYTGVDKKVQTAQHFNHIVTDSLNNTIVTDSGTETIQILDQYGHFIQYLLSPDNVFDDPRGLHIDQSGYLWVSDDHRMLYKLKYQP